MTVLDALPDVEGRYTANAPIGQTGWFRCGGNADVLFKPKDEADLVHFLKHCPAEIPVMAMGVASNLIIRDGGVRGVVIRLGRDFAKVTVDEETYQVTAGAAALDANVAQMSAEAGIGGLEFFSGIPGTIGGALRMNAGAYGCETKDVLISARYVDRQGMIHDVAVADMGMSYRHNGVPEGVIFTAALFQGQQSDAQTALNTIDAIKTRRAETQPIRARTGGSTFANPEGGKAWELIDSVGGRGYRIGGAVMSEKHCNFMINEGEATATDVEALGEEMRARVQDKHDINLRWEIRRVGERK